ncbi:MAG: AraC family transcriptional regulator [Oscillospiraceae bacterium]|nr:AraC family transcriptional regulator [Oscillospiraceae bacterium]
MENEFEIVSYPQMKYLNIFMNSVDYRNQHLHRDLELILMLDGEIEVSLRQASYKAKAPSLILLNTNEMHEFTALGEDAPMLLVFQISPMFFANIYPSISNFAFDCTILESVLQNQDFDLIVDMLIDLGLYYFGKEHLYELYCASALNMLFIKLISLIPYHVLTDEEKKAEGQKASRLSRILNYADENFTHKILLSDIAEQENLSLSYLSHFFRENINQSFQDYVKNLRFNQARRLLDENKNMSLLDVCFQSGYSDYRYLQKAFSERLGCSPAEYRLRNNTGSDKSILKASGASESFLSAVDAIEYLIGWKILC